MNIDNTSYIRTSRTRLFRRIVRDAQFRGYTASDTLARQFEGFFDRQSEGTYSWAVTLDEDGDLSWSDGQASFDKDPEASAGRRFQAWLARVFRIDSQL